MAKQKFVVASQGLTMRQQKKLQEVEEGPANPTKNVTNNTMFVGSTAELAKFLKSQKDK